MSRRCAGARRGRIHVPARGKSVVADLELLLTGACCRGSRNRHRLDTMDRAAAGHRPERELHVAGRASHILPDPVQARANIVHVLLEIGGGRTLAERAGYIGRVIKIAIRVTMSAIPVR